MVGKLLTPQGQITLLGLASGVQFCCYEIFLASHLPHVLPRCSVQAGVSAAALLLLLSHSCFLMLFMSLLDLIVMAKS